MARAESKMIMGYLPIEERHYPALLSLVAPATPAVRMLDPFAGEGAFLDAAAQAWNVPDSSRLGWSRTSSAYPNVHSKNHVRSHNDASQSQKLLDHFYQ